MNQKTQLGILSEKIAERFFLQEGYWLLARNYRTKGGEIDLVLQKGRELLFVEVKGRTNFQADETWSPRWRTKKRRILRAARLFLVEFPQVERMVDEIRLEIVYVTQGRVAERFEAEPFY